MVVHGPEAFDRGDVVFNARPPLRTTVALNLREALQ